MENDTLDNLPTLKTQLHSDENGNLTLEFPDELLQAIGWGDGDILGIETFAGRIIFRKISD